MRVTLTDHCGRRARWRAQLDYFCELYGKRLFRFSDKLSLLATLSHARISHKPSLLATLSHARTTVKHTHTPAPSHDPTRTAPQHLDYHHSPRDRSPPIITRCSCSTRLHHFEVPTLDARGDGFGAFALPPAGAFGAAGAFGLFAIPAALADAALVGSTGPPRRAF